MVIQFLPREQKQRGFLDTTDFSRVEVQFLPYFCPDEEAKIETIRLKSVVCQHPVAIARGYVLSQGFHFPSSSTLSRTRNAVILRIKGRGSGFSSGNWIDPLAVTYFERSFAKAFTADGVG